MSSAGSALQGLCQDGVRTPGVDGSVGLQVCEILGREIVQVAGWPGEAAALETAVQNAVGCQLPSEPSHTRSAGGVTALWTAPETAWLVSDDKPLCSALEKAISPEVGVVTNLSASRSLLRVSGPATRWVLAKGIAVDLSADALPEGHCFQSAQHGILLLLHRLSAAEDPTFDLYVARAFAESFWEWLTEAALESGYEVGEPLRRS